MPDTGEAAPFAADQRQSRWLGQPWTFSFWLLIASLVINTAAVFLMRSHATIASVEADESEYWDIASQLHALGLSGIPARRTLPFPLLLTTLRSIVGDNYFYVQLLVSALLALSPVLIYWLVRRQIGSERAAMLASVGFLLWPPLVRYGASIYSDSIALLLFLVYLLAFPLPSTADRPPLRRWLQFCLAGALLGLCLQMKPLYLLYTPFAFCLAIWSETSFRRGLSAATLLTVGCIVVVAPWSAYVSAREGHFILVSANDGETLAGGLNPTLMTMDNSSVFVTAGGRSHWVGPGKWVYMDKTGYLSLQELELPYAQASALLSARARAWISSNPGTVAYLSARKLLYMWGIYPFWNGPSQSLLGNIPLLLLVAVASFSLWINRHAWRRLAMFWTLPIFSSLVCLISWGSWRFRMPADAGLIILAATLCATWQPPSRERPGCDRSKPRLVSDASSVRQHANST
jgi:4-amino-4-deoxy-L-arabinose transferase-like glycosyltransferase